MHPSWGVYPDTILHFPEADLAVDLRHPVTPAARQALAHLGLAGTFGVVTACDPHGVSHDNRSNQARMAVLEAVVREQYPGAREAIGSAPDGGHSEPGWALPIPLPEATILAARFFQKGMFWYDGDRFSIVPVLAHYPSLMLPIGPGDS